MEAVERGGVDQAYQEAVNTYTQLPRLDRDAEIRNPELAGREQAFHLFFDLLGIDQKTIAFLRNRRKRPLRKHADTGQMVLHREARVAQKTS